MKKISFVKHLKEVSLANGGSSQVQMTTEDINPGKFYAKDRIKQLESWTTNRF